MKKSLITIYILLLIATLATSCISGYFAVFEIVVALIMVLAGLKFLLVAFHFMELKKAHPFWKISLMLTLGLFIVLVVSLKLSS
jgi:uncharacterized membrane protein YidH (DUF202 family)